MTLLYNVDQSYKANATSNYNAGSSNQAQKGDDFLNSVFEKGEAIVKSKVKSTIISKAKELLKSLFGNQAATSAQNAAELNGKAATTANNQIKSMSDIENMVNSLSAEIGKETKIIEDLSNYIQQDLSQAAAQEQAKINEKIAEIKAQQAIIANPSETIDNKLAALDKITGLSSEIQDIIAKCTEIQQLMVEASERIATSEGTIEALSTLGEEQVSEMTQVVTENVADATVGTADATATGVKAGVETATSATCATTGAAATATGVGAPVGGELLEKSAELAIAAGTDGTTSVTAGASFVDTIGGLTNNASILSAFNNFIGTETKNLVGFLGQAKTALEPMITSIGSFASEGVLSADLGTLATAVAADQATLNSQQSIDGQKSYAAQNTEEHAQPELETPKFQFSDFTSSFGV